MPVHPSAILDPQAEIHPSAEIGPFCVIGPDVKIGAGTRLMAHVYVEGSTEIGEENVFYPYATVGVASQDLKYHGERAYTYIGNRNRIREFVSIHRGTEGGGLITRIGDDNSLLAYTHVAHDVQLGNHCVLSNGVTFAGHVTVGDWAVISAHSAVHQFCRIGRHSMIGGFSVVVQDVLPFSLTTGSGREIKLFDVNKVGLERRGFSAEAIQALHKCFRLLRDKKLNTTKAIEAIRAEVPALPEREELLAFIASSERGFIK
ncbi:acyl-ACP--UDP-N-acetylglucosamine O-acyltransferase [Bryobacter aggregatus]|uniref:acyl-ACP--UDP-N-acetylglucosamine O-acyltransferase n=1 Tax=Bryobacter aggregatus TaxID=360054 RepID=UPI0004E1B420|nr:acyl-ACP--UDP-N-acetylglucosamine O-acyltransferase [Bryobacter aggregatus]